ncbi:hypothetical protein FDECE_14453 [Fusarium decemcellulare]|nr:hypothetical protein FDECE_14453 [Fusarium decemcellulare]
MHQPFLSNHFPDAEYIAAAESMILHESWWKAGVESWSALQTRQRAEHKHTLMDVLVVTTQRMRVVLSGFGAGGIGFCLAKEFQKRGLTVFASARDVSKMSELESLENVTLLALDVTSSTSITHAMEEVKSKTGGKLDYLVNNAGQSGHAPVLDVDIEQAMKLFDVNFWGVLRMIQTFATLLIDAKGTIVNMGSIVGILYTPFGSMYNASKAAGNHFSENLRLELAPLDVKVLPPTSQYLAAEKCFESFRNGVRDYNVSEAEELAESVVGDVLNGATGKIWRGANSSKTRWASHLLPTSMFDNILLEGSELDKVGPGGHV